MTLPTVVSFFGGDQYYYEAAELLRQDCDRLGLKHDIREIAIEEGDTWPSICRKKIPFYLDAFNRSPTGILWLDVDSRILQRPDFLDGIHADMGAFLRGFQYARNFDPIKLQRFFAPSFLYFGPTAIARSFLETAASLEREATDVNATDDYFLQEAWLNFEGQLHLDIWPPRFLMIDEVGDPEAAIFHFKSSGNVAVYKGTVQQHTPSMLEVGRKLSVLRLLKAAAIERKDRAAEKLYNLEINRLDPTDQRAAVGLAKDVFKTDPTKARKILKTATVDRLSDQVAKRNWTSFELEFGDLVRARVLGESLMRSETRADHDFARSKLYRIGLEERGRAFDPADRPPLWWMETPFPGNFGDILNPYIVEKLGGIPPRREAAENAILMIGSIIKFARIGSKVWGAGTPRMTDTLSRHADYRAVRGPLTRELVLSSGGQCAPIYGDCAWFLPQVYQPGAAKAAYRYGFIRHLVHREVPLHDDRVVDISLARVGDADIEQFIDQIHQCEKIVTTSLHGLITAHAYGIPAIHCAIAGEKGELPGDGTKFADYFLSVGIEPYAPIPVDPGALHLLDQVPGLQWLPSRGIDLQRLASVAPFPIVANIRSFNLSEI